MRNQLLAAILAVCGASANAADGCTVLLCLAGNWKDIRPCVPPVREVLRDIARGRHFPSCSMGGNSAAGNTSVAAIDCPPQYRTSVTMDGYVEYMCPFAGVIDANVEGKAWSRTWWTMDGDTVTEWTPTAKASFAASGTPVDDRFDRDYATWVAAEEAKRIAAEEAAAAAASAWGGW